MRLKKLFNGAAAAGLGLLLVASGARANTLLPGSSGVLPDPFGTVGTAINPVTVLANTGVQSYTLSGSAGGGTYQEWVVDGDTLNANGLTALDFVIEVSPSAGNLKTVSITNFDSFLVDGGQATTMVTTSTTLTSGLNPIVDMGRDTSGTINLGFTEALTPPASQTEFLVLKTNATHFFPGTINIIDGGVSADTGFAPTAVPAPASLWGGAGLLGLMGIFGVRRRRMMA